MVRLSYAGKLVSHAPTSHAAHGHLSISDFKLVDHMGQPASSDDVLGEFVLFYFGAATNPATNEAMGKLSETVRQIGRLASMPGLLLLPFYRASDCGACGHSNMAIGPDCVAYTSAAGHSGGCKSC